MELLDNLKAEHSYYHDLLKSLAELYSKGQLIIADGAVEHDFYKFCLTLEIEEKKENDDDR